jgi:hypothetical protein
MCAASCTWVRSTGVGFKILLDIATRRPPRFRRPFELRPAMRAKQVDTTWR